MKRQETSLFIAALAMLGLFFSPASLAAAASYFEQKAIKIVVGSTPGGGYDRMARLVARHLPKYLPGKPSVIVENMPGAGHIIGANYIYNIAKPDRISIGAFQPGIVFAQLMKVEGVKYDARRYAWVGSMAVEGTILAVRTELPFKNFEDLRKEKNPVHMASSGVGGKDHLYTTLLKELFGMNIKMVNYPAATESMLAINRKEVDGKAGSFSSLKPFIERGVVRALIRGRVLEPGMENLPVDEELAVDKNAKAIFAMRSAGDQMGRPFVAPPGTPPQALNALRDAFAKAAKDPDLIGEAKKYMLDIDYVPGEQCLKVVQHLFSQPEHIVKDFAKYSGS